MDILKIVLLVVLISVGGGCLIGILSGKHAVKKATNQSKPLLSMKERIIYGAMMVAGAACILAGIFLVSPADGNPDMMNPGIDDYEDGGYYGEEDVMVYGDMGGENWEEDSEELSNTDEDALEDGTEDQNEYFSETPTDEANSFSNSGGGSTNAGSNEVVIVGNNSGVAILR